MSLFCYFLLCCKGYYYLNQIVTLPKKKGDLHGWIRATQLGLIGKIVLKWTEYIQGLLKGYFHLGMSV